MNLLTQNSKLKKDGIWSFGLPPVKTCPFAGACKSFCYARKGCYRYPNVSKAQDARFKLSRSKHPDEFVDAICGDIIKKKAKFVRIHDSGDFYSWEYLYKWVRICTILPHVQFYAYTKSLPYFTGASTNAQWWPYYAPKNLRIIFSAGGRFDHLIDKEKHRHAYIFETKKDLLAAGYVDASESDMVAITTNSNKIGLVRH